MAFTKINAAGIGTTETVTVDGLTVINDGSFGGNLTVSGVLTYEDVTNVDSVGLITARNGIVVGSGITLSKDGDIFATGITTVSGNVKVGTGITLSPDGDIFATGITTVSGTTVSGNVKVGSGITLSPDGDVFATGVTTSNSGLIVGNGRVRVTGPSTITNNAQTIMAVDSADDNTAGLGGKIGFAVNVNETTRTLAAVGGLKSIAGTGDFSGDLALYTRRNGVSNLDERLRISSDGNILVNHTTGRGVGNSSIRLLQVEGTAAEAAITVVRNSNNTSGAGINLGKSRTSSVGGNTIVQDGDKLGVISFAGADGVDLETNAAQITGEVDGTPGSNDMPGRLVFKTRNSGGGSTVERLKIDSIGLLTVTTTDSSSGIRLVDGSNSSGSPNLEIISKRSDSNGNTAFSSNIFLGKNRTDAKVSSGIILGLSLIHI